MKTGKAKLFNDRKELDGEFHRGGKGRRARLSRKHKRTVERGLRQASRKLCKGDDG